MYEVLKHSSRAIVLPIISFVLIFCLDRACFTLAVQQSFPNSIRVPLKTHSYSLKVNSIGDSSDLGTIACLTLNCTLISF